MVLETCRNMLQEAVEELWPELPCRVALRPCLDQNMGDLSSNCCLQIAAQLREDPEAVADRIMAALPREFPGNCSTSHGFFNIVLHELGSKWLKDEPAWAGLNRFGSVSVVLPPVPDRSSPDALQRLVLLGIMQCLCVQAARIDCCLYSGAKPLSEGALRLQALLPLLMDQAATAPAGSSDKLRDELREALDKAAGMKCLWLTPASLEKRQFNLLYHEKVRNHEDVILQCPERGWLSGCDEMLQAAHRFSEWSERQLAALCLYAASTLPGCELDPAVPRLEESSNTLWFMRSVYDRMVRFGLEPLDGVPALSGLDEERRSLAVRVYFLPWFLKAAAVRGEVREYAAVLDQFLRTTIRVFNAPAFRMRSETGKVTQSERQIMTGVLEALSDTIGAWSAD